MYELVCIPVQEIKWNQSLMPRWVRWLSRQLNTTAPGAWALLLCVPYSNFVSVATLKVGRRNTEY